MPDESIRVVGPLDPGLAQSCRGTLRRLVGLRRRPLQHGGVRQDPESHRPKRQSAPIALTRPAEEEYAFGVVVAWYSWVGT